jgi:Arc/MetJ family transcription regulator
LRTPGTVRAASAAKRFATACFQPGIVPLHEFAPMCQSVCGGLHMATNLSIDPELIERALEVSGERTKKAAVTKALEEFIARRQQRRVLELFGKLEWDAAYDYKAERKRK